MANDIDMWNDMEEMDKRTSEYKILSQCYQARYIEYDEKTAEKWKDVFINIFGYWGNYY